MVSIFAKRAFLNINATQEFEYNGKRPKKGHLLRVSSMIRADQIASQIGAKLNPTEGYEDDVCIYVKPHVQANRDFTFEGKKSWLDIIDGWGLIPLVEKHPEVGIIACSLQDYHLLSRILPNKIVLIPQHHCNFEQLRRERKKIKTVGIIGTESSFANLPKGLEEGLKARKMNLIKFSKFFSREDIIDFYMSIDIQLVWRPYRMRLSNPLKIVNASSFGIPTIAYEESTFKEVYDAYLPVLSIEGFFDALDSFLVSPSLYDQMSLNCRARAEDYSIEKIGELYKQL